MMINNILLKVMRLIISKVLRVASFSALIFIPTVWVLADDKADFKIAPAYHCAANPKFIRSAGMQQPVAIDTQQSLLPGIVFKELRGAQRLYRHPSWEMSGHVASTVRDSAGNIYAIPVPSLGLDTNPLSRRNTIYRIDSATGIMSIFVELPMFGASSQKNPFGTLGLTLDCDSQSLYVSSVANSTPRESNGVIYKINLTTRKIESQLPNVDAIGLGIFNHSDGKRLYYGDARSSSVYSLALSSNGQFLPTEMPRHELSLLEIRNGDTTQVQKVRFQADKEYGYKLVVTDTEFSYRLLAESHKRFRHYEYVWDNNLDKWVFLKIR